MDTTNNGTRPDGECPTERPQKTTAPLLHLWVVLLSAERDRKGKKEMAFTGGCVACGTRQDAMQWGAEEAKRRYPPLTGWKDHRSNIEGVPAGLVLQVANGYRQTELTLNTQETQTNERPSDEGPNPRT